MLNNDLSRGTTTESRNDDIQIRIGLLPLSHFKLQYNFYDLQHGTTHNNGLKHDINFPKVRSNFDNDSKLNSSGLQCIYYIILYYIALYYIIL